MNNKALYAVILFTVVALLAVGGILFFTQQVGQQTRPQPDIPRYTADQVVAVAKAQYPVGYRIEYTNPVPGGFASSKLIETPTSISVAYIGTGVWKVVVSASGYHVGSPSSGVSLKTLYFYESDGSLR